MSKPLSHVQNSLRTLLHLIPLSSKEQKGRCYIPYADRDYPAPTRYLRLPAGKIAYVEKGRGRPIVFVHGFGGNLEWWIGSIQKLSNEFRCIAYDHPGHGKSEKRDQKYTISLLTETLHDFLQALQLKDPILVGHSMGGGIVLNHILKYPKTVRKAVVVAPAGIRPPENRLLRIVSNLSMKQDGLPKYLFPRTMGRSAIQMTKEMIDQIYLALHVTQDPEWPQLRQALVSLLSDFLKFSLLGEMKKIREEILVIWGQQDRLEPFSLATDLKGEIPQARLVPVPNCGHHPMLEQPALYERALRDFL